MAIPIVLRFVGAIPLEIPHGLPTPLGSNTMLPIDRTAHEWYRFVLGFPPHLVRKYIEEFGLAAGDILLDPFCGTGTTLVEGKKHGLRSIGFEPNPVARFASQVKTDWSADGRGLQEHALAIAERTQGRLRIRRGRLRSLPEGQLSLLLSNSISPVPLHKTLILLDEIRCANHPIFTKYELLALARALTGPIGNLRFGPEVGVSKPKLDADAVGAWVTNIDGICADLHQLPRTGCHPATIYDHDARDANRIVQPLSVKAVITSPPYPNEKDYTRATRLESVILGFLTSREQIRGIKQFLVRSNTKNVFKGDTDDHWVDNNAVVQELAIDLESKLAGLSKASGFERLYPKVTKLYFGGMARHLANLRECLEPGARLAYVVGDQASFFQVLIRTGLLLGEIAEELGYTVVRRDLFRNRYSAATRSELREEVLVLRWPGFRVRH